MLCRTVNQLLALPITLFNQRVALDPRAEVLHHRIEGHRDVAPNIVMFALRLESIANLLKFASVLP